jgi:adenylyltransferase/sulfurtransferase
MVPASRYARQIVLPEIGEEGQRTLAARTVVVVGLGALGTVAASLLARAGVGRMRLVDRDVVETTNLQRQLLFTEADVDRPKATAAAERLRAINSAIAVDARPKDLHFATAESLLGDADLVVDGLDNMETRFLVNDFCVREGMAWVYAGAVATQGMVMPVLPGTTACLRCLLRHPPPPGTLATCDTAGILNAASTMTAALAVAEALKLLLGREPSKVLHVLDPWLGEWTRLGVARRPDCPACGLGTFEFLEAKGREVLVALCGRNVMSLDPLHRGSLDLAALAGRLRNVGRVRETDGLLLVDTGAHQLTIFPDGRALVRGTDDPKVARSLYAKYIGV